MIVLTELVSEIQLAIPRDVIYGAFKSESSLVGSKVLTSIPSEGLNWTRLSVKESPEEIVEKSGGVMILLTLMDKAPMGLHIGTIVFVHKTKDAILGSTILTSLPSKNAPRTVFTVLENVETIVTKVLEAKAMLQQQQQQLLLGSGTTRH